MLKEPQGLSATGASYHVVAKRLERELSPACQGFFIIDKENPFMSSEDRYLGKPFYRGIVHAWQVDGEHCALSGHTGHRNGSPVVGDDAMDDGQAQTRAFTDRFRGEEGLKDVLQ
jgi:hypothetical protein